MPKFTIECTFDVPHFRHTTYEADTVEAAMALALADEEWDHQKKDYDSSSDTRIAGIWEGEDAAYMGKAIDFPDDPATLLRAAAPDMLAALKAIMQGEPCAGSCALENHLSQCPCDLAWSAIAKAEGRDP